MSTIKGFIFCILIGTLSACGQQAEVFQDTHGTAYEFNKLRGKWVILSYWADWCHTCRKEIKHLNAFAKHHQRASVLVLGVNFDHLGGDQLPNVMQEVGIQYPVLTTDPARLLQLGDIPGLPLTVVIAPTGKIYKKLYGEQSEASLLKEIAPLGDFTETAAG